ACPTCRAVTCSTRRTSWMTRCSSARSRRIDVAKRSAAQSGLEPARAREGAAPERRSGRSMIDRPVVGLVATGSPDFVIQAFACWKAGAAVVTLRSRDDQERLRLAGGSELRMPAAGDGWLDAALEPRDDDAVAQILFTSGTEG